MLTIESLIPYVAACVPGCPDALIKWGLQMAAQDFFRDTELWRIECDPVVTVNEATVELDVPTGTAINAIYQLYAGARQIATANPNEVADLNTVWMTKTAVEATNYWQASPTAIRLYPIPTTSVTISAYLSVVPGVMATQIPEVIGDMVQTLSYGALWKLQSMTGKAWSNDVAASANGALFNSGCIRAKINSTRAGNGAMSITLARV